MTKQNSSSGMPERKTIVQRNSLNGDGVCFLIGLDPDF